FDIDVVAEVAAVEIEAALEILDDAVSAGLIAEDGHKPGWYRFTHALTAQALYDAIGLLRRSRLHRRIGTAAARTWTSNTDKAADITRHWLLTFCRAAHTGAPSQQ